MTRLLIDPAVDLPDAGSGPVTLTATLLDPDPAGVFTYTIDDASTVVTLNAPALTSAWRLTVRRPRTVIGNLGIRSDPGPIVSERTVRWPDGGPIAWAALTDVDPATFTTLDGNPDPALDTLRTQILGGASAAYDTLKELETALSSDTDAVAALTAAVAGKATPAQVDSKIAAQAATDAASYQSMLVATSATSTAAVNAWLAAASPLGVKRLVGSLILTAPLTIPSNTTLDATGATVTEGAGVNNQMLRNPGSTTSTAGDVNIAVIGGTWDRGANAGQANDNTLHTLQFYGVTGLKVKDLTVKGTAGKYAVHLYACNQFEVGNLTFNTFSDGVHLNGACADGWVHDIRGITGDDFVAYTLVDYATYQAGGYGDSYGIVIERIYGNPAAGKGGTSIGNGVAIYGGLNPSTSALVTHRNLTIRDIHVTSVGAAVQIVAVANSGTTAASAAYVGVTIDGVSNEGTGHAISLGAGTYSDIAARRITAPASASKYPIFVTTGTLINDLTVSDSVWNSPASTAGIKFAAGTIINLRLARITYNVATQSGSFVDQASGTTLTRVFFADITVLKAAWALGAFTGTTDIRVSNLSTVQGSVSGYFIANNAAAVLTVSWASSYNAGPSGFGTTAGAQVISRDMTFPCDVSSASLVRAANAMAYNTNAALACGAGPVVCNGTSWKHLYTGAIY